MNRTIRFLLMSFLLLMSCNLPQVLFTPTDPTQTPEIDTPFVTDSSTQENLSTAIPTESPTETPNTPPIGNVTRELDNVEKGFAEQMLEVLVGTHPLYSGESLRISNGGEGLLDFGDNVRLRLFNDSVLGQIRLESAPGTPLDIRMFLENGGFTGSVTEPGGQVVVETPNGAEIKVLGTNFFIIHDPIREITAAGNFAGEIEMAAGGELRDIPEGSLRWVGIEQRISPSIPFPLNMQDFDLIAREQRSPLTTFRFGLSRLQPPEILSVEVDPEIVFIGEFCPDNEGIAFVEVDTLAEGGLTEVIVDWSLGELSGQVVLESDDGEIYLGEVGPFEQFGTVELQVRATNLAGIETQAQSVFVDVIACIG